MPQRRRSQGLLSGCSKVGLHDRDEGAKPPSCDRTIHVRNGAKTGNDFRIARPPRSRAFARVHGDSSFSATGGAPRRRHSIERS